VVSDPVVVGMVEGIVVVKLSAGVETVVFVPLVEKSLSATYNNRDILAYPKQLSAIE